MNIVFVSQAKLNLCTFVEIVNNVSATLIQSYGNIKSICVSLTVIFFFICNLFLKCPCQNYYCKQTPPHFYSKTQFCTWFSYLEMPNTMGIHTCIQQFKHQCTCRKNTKIDRVVPMIVQSLQPEGNVSDKIL